MMQFEVYDIIITKQVYETTRENISNRLITRITIIKKNILKDDKILSLVVGLNLYIHFLYKCYQM
jgi:hypothetical protein